MMWLTSMVSPSTPISNWRLVVLFTFVLGSLVWFFTLSPIPQDLAHHSLADSRRVLGIPNTIDVLSNLPFLIVGILGIRIVMQHCLKPLSLGWLVLFIGVSLVSVGSAYYHWAPENDSLVWDRLPLTVGFMGLFVSLVGEYFDPRLPKMTLIPAIMVGISSVIYWRLTDDLRFYIWVQYMPMGVIVISVALLKSRFSHSYLLAVALGWYLLGKLFEANDAAVFRYSQEVVSGHSIKHLLAAAGCYTLVVYFRRRRFLER